MIARIAIWLGIIALTAVVYRSGNTSLRDALPMLITACVAWLFARTLRTGRTPLIARAIASLDGAELLADAAVARYARRLTQLWAAYLLLLASIVAALALHARYAATTWAWLPSAQRFGALGVPLAVAALLLGEFALRRWLLPQAPRRSVFGFLRGLTVAWPYLLDDRAVADAHKSDDAGRTT